ncbi:MAG: hypothetical protein H6625_09125 [Bdellovibrionaceae bacterium]|nr:hypothetical protein [Pseudobdellovibrionaceae bacterium]
MKINYMTRFWKSFFCWWLSVSLILITPAPGGWQFAQAQEGPSQEALETAANEYTKLVMQYEAVLDHKPADKFTLDEFSLLQQDVKLKTKRVLDYDEWVDVPVKRMVNVWDLKLQVKDFTDNALLASLSMLKKSKHQSSYSCELTKVCRFQLIRPSKFKTETVEELNNFYIPATTIAFLDSFIVFVRPNSYSSAKGVQRVSFIDLERYDHMLGNEKIPVFEIPLVTDQELTELKVEDGHLLANGGYYIHSGQLKDLSSIYQTAFNLTGNLLNPKHISSTIELVNDIDVFLNKETEAAKDKSWLSVDHLKRANLSTETLYKELKEKLKSRADIAQYIQSNSQILHQAKESGDKSKEEVSAEEKSSVLEEFSRRFLNQDELDKAEKSVAETITAGRRLTTKVHRLYEHLISPNPNTANRIEMSIASIMGYMHHKLEKVLSTKEKTGFISSIGAVARSFVPPFGGLIKSMGNGARFLQAFASKKNISASLVAAMALGLAMPDSVGMYYMQALDAGIHMVNGFGKSLVEIGNAIWISTVEITSVYWSAPSTIYNGLIADGKWSKLMIGLSGLAGVLALVIGGYHAVQNTYNLVKDMKSPQWKGLVERQKKIEDDYLAALSKGEQERRRSTDVYSPEDDAEVERLIELSNLEMVQNKEKFKKNPLIKPFVMSYNFMVGGFKYVGNTLKRFYPSGMSSEKLIAFKHVYFSFASYAKTILHYTGVWNAYSAARYSLLRWGYKDIKGVTVPYLRLTPILFASRFLYPKMFETIIEKKQLPTELNGGREPLKSVVSRWLSRSFSNTSADSWQKQDKAMKAAEEEIIAIEEKVVRLAFKKALRATVKYVEEDSELKSLFESEGISSITDKVIRKLSLRNKVFMRAYFEKVYEESMERILIQQLDKMGAENIQASLMEEAAELFPGNLELQAKLESVSQELEETGETSEATLVELKKMIASAKMSNADMRLEISDSEIQILVDEVASDKSVFGIANKTAQDFKSEVVADALKLKMNDKLVDYITHEISADFDPNQDGSMKRYGIVQEKRKKPLAMARAVRSEVSNILVTLPLDIVFLLLLTAGITEATNLYMPIQEEMFSQNSVFYLSRYSFYGSLVSGVLMGLLANSWTKLQQDHRHDELGSFGSVPKGNDANKSFLSWFWKQANKRDNSLWENWKEYSKIVWHNIPAYLLNMITFNMLFIGFFDLDAWVSSLVMFFSLPISAYTMKIEQAFEKAAYYDAKIFPEKYLSHPMVQRYLQTRTQGRRNKFNLLFDIFRNTIGYIESNAAVTPTPEFENRAFSRALYGGKEGTLLGEKILNSTSGLEESTKDIPIVGKITKGISAACDFVLKNGQMTRLK